MRRLVKFALAGALGLGLTTAAEATDLYVDVVQPVPVADQFNWDGFYIGIQKGWWFDEGLLLHGVAGTNFLLSDRVVLGVEGRAGILTDFSGTTVFDVNAGARLGALLGDDVLLYKRVDIGVVQGTTYYGLGAGLELVVSDTATVRGEVEGLGAVGSSISEIVASAALLWHLN